MIIKIIVFLIGTAGILLITFLSASKLRSYGLLRFFTFESLLALIIVNADSWFLDPFSVVQLISWLLLAASIAMVSFGFYMLRKQGKSEKAIDDTTTLVTQGIYKYIRHPLYASLILLALGSCLKELTAVSVMLALLTSALAIAIAKVEERENIRKFGEKYLAYMHTTKMFIPFII